ncbi:MAG TPA: hypothetical protein VNJ31_09880, partial [Methyloceanibacter sp.]|nr:hypothetical protein [Methyloceanibacter sp.]
MPVFLIYAGIIHLIGLALLLPMIVTLPGSLDRAPPRASVIDVKVEIVPDGTAPGEAGTTAALPKPSEASGAEAAAGAAAAPAAEASPETAPAGEGEPKPPVDEDEEKD